MKIKSVIAAVAASAIACSAMALSAAAEVFSKTGNEGDAIYTVPVDGVDVSKINKIVVEVSCDHNKLEGTIGYNDTTAESKWTKHGTDGTEKFVCSAEAGAITGTWELDNIEGEIADSKIEVQFTWIEPDGDNKGTGKIESVKLYDKDGNELKPNMPETTTTEATTTTQATTTAKKDDKKDDKKSSTSSSSGAKTGDAGVGVAVAALSLAGAAAIATRKKH